MSEPHEYCTNWFDRDRSHNRHPVTGDEIDPESTIWNEIEESCSEFISDVSLVEMKHSGDSVSIPKIEVLRTEIKGLVDLVWSNPLANKRSTSGSTDGASDLFAGAYWKHPQMVCPSSNSEAWSDFHTLDDRKDLMKHTTSFMTTYMLGSITTRLRFLKLIAYSFGVLFETLHKAYPEDARLQSESLFLVLKGGMALRMNILEMIRAFSSETEGVMVDLLHAELQLSDFDFEVISRDLTSDEVTRLNILTFLLTMQIRNHIEDHREYYMDFFQYSAPYQHTLVSALRLRIQAACGQLPTTNFFHGITVDYISFGQNIPTDHTSALYTDRNAGTIQRNRSDFAMVVDGRTQLPVDDRSDLCFISARNLLRRYKIPTRVINSLCRQSLLFTSHNPLIAFSDDRVTSAFQLNRIKYGFKVYFQKKASDGTIRLLSDYFPGELLDVSHQLHNDTRKTLYALNEQHPRYHESSVRHISDLRFNTLTPYGQIQEHRFMLFKAVVFPWDVDKYEKRITRMLCIFFLFVFSPRGPRYSFRRKLAFMEDLRTDITNETMYSSMHQPFILRQIRFDIVHVLKTSSRTEYVTERDHFRSLVLDMLSTLISLFAHEYRRSRNPKLTIKEYDPLVFTQLYTSDIPRNP